MTTLEEVFLKVNAEERDSNPNNEADKEKNPVLNDTPNEAIGYSLNKEAKKSKNLLIDE